METELYYVVTPQIDNSQDGFVDVSGNTDIDLYQIVNNKPVKIKTLDSELDENPEEVIENYIEEIAPELFLDNGKQLFSLTQL